MKQKRDFSKWPIGKLPSSRKIFGRRNKATLKDSVKAMNKKRKGLVFAAISDIVNVLKDCRSNAVGGMKVAIEIWELSIIPFLLNSSETWLGKTKEELNILQALRTNLDLRKDEDCVLFFRWVIERRRSQKEEDQN